MNGFKSKISHGLIPTFMLVSSVTLLVISVPRFLYELMLVPGTPILERIHAGRTVTSEELQVVEESRLSALDFVEAPKAYVDLGSIYMAHARLAESSEEQRRYAQMTIQTSMKGLEMAPLNTFAWLRVAAAGITLGPDHYETALIAWRRSITTARFEPIVLLQRIHLGIILYQAMAPDDLDTLKDQLEVAYRWNRVKLRDYLWQNKLADWGTLLSTPESEVAQYLAKHP